MLFRSLNLQIDCLGPQTCSVGSSRSLNLEITRLGPQTCSVVSSRSLNLILNFIWVKTGQSKNFILKNNSKLFHMNSNEDKIYAKTIALNTVYNFVVDFFI